jgi:hypothetical protein
VTELIQIQKTKTSETFWKTWDRCQQQHHYQHEMKIEPKDRPPWDPRNVGDVAHYALDAFHLTLVTTGNLDSAVSEALIRVRAKSIGDLEKDHELRRVRIVVTELMRTYANRWPDPEWQSFKGEDWFNVPIEHPVTHELCEWFEDRGKRDGVVRADRPFRWGSEECAPGLYLVEHKIQTSIDEKEQNILRHDPQTILYAYATARELLEPVAGILFNLAAKCGLDQKRAESQSDFEERKAHFERRALMGEIRGNKVRRRKDETDEEFNKRAVEYGLEEFAKLEREPAESDDAYRERVRAWYTPDAFVRFVARPTSAEIARARMDRWARAQLFLLAKRNGIIVRNRGKECYAFGRACDYLPLCDSGEDPNILENEYRIKRKMKDAAADEAAALEQARRDSAQTGE